VSEAAAFAATHPQHEVETAVHPNGLFNCLVMRYYAPVDSIFEGNSISYVAV
jgi:hypothetical protein